jgi:hypothetical protein
MQISHLLPSGSQFRARHLLGELNRQVGRARGIFLYFREVILDVKLKDGWDL